MQELFLKNGTDPQRIKEIITVLSAYIDEEGMFNFKAFLSHLSWVQQKFKSDFFFIMAILYSNIFRRFNLLKPLKIYFL